MSPTLLPELWLKIFSLLFRHPPTIIPNHMLASGPRAPFRQPDLLPCMLVNKSWYSLAASCLYSDVTTNQLPSFLSGIFNKPIPGIPSKRELLNTVRALTIVYGPSNPFVGPHVVTYEDLMEYGAFGAFSDHLDGAERRDFQGVRLACQLARAWQTLFTKSGRPRGIFQQLERVITTSCAEHEDKYWGSVQSEGDADSAADYRTDFGRDLGSKSAGWRRAILTAQHLLCDFLRHTPSIRHYCQSGCKISPLSICFHVVEEGNRPTFASHDYAALRHSQPVWLGTQTRHYVHARPLGEEAGEEDDWEEEWLSVDQALCARQNAAGLGPLAEGAIWNLQGGYYNPDWQDDHWAEEAEDLKESVARSIDITKEVLPSWVYVTKDHWEVTRLAPPCDACGWKADIVT